MFVHQHALQYLLRPEHYTSQSHYDLEIQRLFRTSWQLVGTKSELKHHGDFRSFSLFGEQLQLRNQQGHFIAFQNVCPHRHCLLTGLAKGRSDVIRCQYHGWEFKETGKTAFIPEAQCFKPWDRDNSQLSMTRLESCGDLLFVNLSGDAPPLREWLSPYFKETEQAFQAPVMADETNHGIFSGNNVITSTYQRLRVMLITPPQFRYLLIYQSLLPFVINPIVCSLIGWWDYRAMQTLPVWGLPKSMSVDLLATSFLLPFITCLIASPLIKRDLRNDVVKKIATDHNSPWLLRFYKRPVFLRAFLCGLSGSILVGSMVLVFLNLLSFNEVPVNDFMLGKLLFAAIYGALATPLIAILELSNQSE